MKSISKLLFALTALIFSCSSNEEITATTEDLAYFPLEVGNRWEYEPLRPESHMVASAIFTITKTEIRDGRKYFVMERQFEEANGARFSDSVHYYVDGRGYVFETMSYDNIERNSMRLGAADGFAWTIKMPQSEDLVVTTSFRDITLKGNVLFQCKEFYYNAHEVIDEEHNYILAKGIGIIQHGNAWGFDYKLKSARIGGVDF